MTRTRRTGASALIVTSLIALGACASRAGAAAGPADLETIAGRSAAAGIAPELVRVTDVEGYTLATQSVGVVGDDGMSAVYVSPDGGASVTLTTWREALDPSVVACADLPDDAPAPVRCTVEQDVAVVLLEGDGADVATLRAAGEAVRVPSAGELAGLFVDLRTPEAPVERGDLPPGDGAPVDPPALGG